MIDKISNMWFYLVSKYIYLDHLIYALCRNKLGNLYDLNGQEEVEINCEYKFFCHLSHLLF